MKYISLDIGEKRVGVATSDDSGIIASPHSVISVSESFLEDLGKIIKLESPDKVVLGLPRHQNGQESKEAEHIREFAKVIQHEYNVEVDFEDESATSIEAERRLKERGLTPLEIKKQVDAEAAAVILEGYLARH